jgi:arylsulfatase A-like enzyme
MRRALPLAPLLLACLACGEAAPAAPPPPPNVLLLVIDCLRGDALSAVGYQRPTTPHLDALAREGVLFRHAFAQASWTRPSLPTLLTGLYPSEHGMLDLGDENAENAPALSPVAVTLGERFAAAGYATAMFGEQHKLAPRFGLGQGFTRWEHRTGNAVNIHTKLRDWTAALPAGQRFFAYLHYLELHWPYCPRQELRGRFDDGSSDLNICADWRRLRDDMRSGAYVLTPADHHLLRARYDEELAGVDAALGELFAELRRRQLWDDTLVVVTADHGEEFAEHGGYFHGHTLFDELIHVPLVIKPPASWPGPRGATLDPLAELRDVPATLLAAAGLDARPAGTVDLLPWVRGEEGAGRSFVVAESVDQVALRTSQWKLIAERSSGRLALYDLTRDPRETRDVAAAHPEELATLRRHLVAWRQSLAPIERSSVDIDPETLQGLKNLGYVQ